MSSMQLTQSPLYHRVQDNKWDIRPESVKIQSIERLSRYTAAVATCVFPKNREVSKHASRQPFGDPSIRGVHAA